MGQAKHRLPDIVQSVMIFSWVRYICFGILDILEVEIKM